jgi:TonB family protein
VVAGLVVIGLHIVLIAGVLAAFVGKPGIQPGPSRTMVIALVPDERQPPKLRRELADIKPRLIPPHFEVTAVTPIPVQVETVGSILATSTSDSPPFERLITEAEARNPAFLRDYCTRQILSVDGVAKTGTVVLMIRVEDDGHISDSKIEESSGNPNVDAATQACITEMGLFQAHLSSGHTIASWQRAHWMWTSGG